MKTLTPITRAWHLSATRLLAFCGLMLVGLSACTEHRSLPPQLASFKVSIDKIYGSLETPLPFPDRPTPVSLTITAINNRNEVMRDFEGEVELFAAPGVVQTPDAIQQVHATLSAGKGSVDLALVGIYGRTHVCVRDTLREDQSSYAVGCSPTLYFDMPRIDQVQVTSDATTSPLVGNFLEVRTGDMIVTGILAEGFYVTDLTAPAPADASLPGNFGSLFVFSFSYPDGIVIGDRVSSIIGTMQEFTGATQMVFPSWTRKEVPTDRCAVPSRVTPAGCKTPPPSPVQITDALCQAPTTPPTQGMCGHSTTNIMMESLESSVVWVEDIVTPTTWMDCDFNLDGDVSNYDASCDASLDWATCEPALEQADSHTRNCCEIACKVACNLDTTCSELSSLRTYGQWSASMNGGAGPKVNFLTRQGFPELDPLDPKSQGVHLDVTGILRHSLPARPRWVIVARQASDIVYR